MISTSIASYVLVVKQFFSVMGDDDDDGDIATGRGVGTDVGIGLVGSEVVAMIIVGCGVGRSVVPSDSPDIELKYSTQVSKFIVGSVMLVEFAVVISSDSDDAVVACEVVVFVVVVVVAVVVAVVAAAVVAVVVPWPMVNELNSSIMIFASSIVGDVVGGSRDDVDGRRVALVDVVGGCDDPDVASRGTTSVAVMGGWESSATNPSSFVVSTSTNAAVVVVVVSMDDVEDDASSRATRSILFVDDDASPLSSTPLSR